MKYYTGWSFEDALNDYLDRRIYKLSGPRTSKNPNHIMEREARSELVSIYVEMWRKEDDDKLYLHQLKMDALETISGMIKLQNQIQFEKTGRLETYTVRPYK